MSFQLEAPTTVAIVQSDSTLISPPLRGLDIWADGDVKITDAGNRTVTRTFTAPFRWVVQIQKIWDTDTTVADADLDGLR